MYQVVAVSHDPTLLSLLKTYCQQSELRWKLRVFPTPGSFLAAPLDNQQIDMLVFDAQSSASALEERRLVCFMAPYALRVVVTTPAHEDVVIEHLSMFHSFVSRDISFEHLSQLLINAERLSVLPLREDERLRIGKLQDYPVLSQLSRDLQTLLRDPKVAVAQVAQLIAHEPVVVSRLLQLVNSPYMGFASETLSLETAISRLGYQLLETLVLMLTVKSQLKDPRLNQVLDSQLSYAGKCRELAKQLSFNRLQQDQVFIVALLSGFGKLVLLRNGCELTDPELQDVQAPERLTYLAVTAFLLTLWGFDEALVSLVIHQQQWRDGPEYKVAQCLWVARHWQHGALRSQDKALLERIKAAGYGVLLPAIHSSA